VADPRIKELAYDALAATLGAPVDLFATALRPLGYRDQPVLGSQFIRQRLPQQQRPEIPSPMPEFQRAARASEIPQVDEFGRVIREAPVPERQFSPMERFVGAAETAESVLRGVAGFPVALVGGVAQGIREGDVSAKGLEGRMSSILQNLGYTPKTEAGQEMLGQTGKFFERLETEYKLPPIGGAPSAAPLLGVRGVPAQVTTAVAEELATPPRGAIGPIDLARNMTPRSPIGFYSAVEETVANIPQAKGTGDQFLAQIQKTPGVKPDEIQWTGLDDFLKGKKSVTKQEIQDYLAANRVDVQEVRLGEMSPEQLDARNQAIRRYQEITDSIADTRQKVEEGLLSSQEARAILEPLTAERYNLDRTINTANQSINTKFSQYTLPGGENYREILLTLPQKQPTIEPIDTSKWNVVTVQQSPTTGSRQVQVFDEQNRLVGQRFAFQGSDQDAIQEVLPGRLERQTETAFQQQNFRSSHFDQPNILAHMRVNDRVVDGKKTLFIEEIQSDWHQAGRKQGYQKQTRPMAEIMKELDSLVDELRSKPGVSYAPSEADWARYPEITSKHDALQAEFVAATKQKTGVPDAPFKTTWHELSLKRAIQEASEKGYDKIAFTTGQTQAARYALSKQIDAVKATRQPDGLYSIEAYKDDAALGRGRNPLIEKNNLTAEELENTIGKELAKKIVSDVSGDAFTKTYSGVDLDIGGEGMKGFYDNILPKSLDNLGKKFDAKVGKTTMDGVEVWSMDITPKMRESAKTKGQPLFQVLPPAAAAGAVQEEEEVE
jgi:hypothetical protein